MIRTNAEYKRAVDTVRENKARVELQRAAFVEERFGANEIDNLMEPILSFHAQIADEVAFYERIRAGEIPLTTNIAHLGYALIQVRIASGMSQRDEPARFGREAWNRRVGRLAR